MDSSSDITSGKSCRSCGLRWGQRFARAVSRARQGAPYCENYRLLRSVGPTSLAWGPRRDSNPRHAV
jgi:hypothetical protein